MPLLRGGILGQQVLVDLAGVAELQDLQWDDREGLSIGAMVTQRHLETSALLREKCAALAEAISRVASVPVRNLGTMGGNLCHAGPGADPPAILIALGASLRIASLLGMRTLAVEDFFAGPYETRLTEAEVLVAVQVPPLPPGAKAVYLKHAVRAIDPAIVGIAAMVELRDGLVRQARLGMVGAAPQPSRARAAEDILVGRPLEDRAIRQAALSAAGESDPLSDGYASAGYRRKMVSVFVRRALERLGQPDAGAGGVNGG